MKKIIALFIIIGLLTIGNVKDVFSDHLRVPFSCYPRRLQKQFAEYGYKLDLDAVDRTKESWGFLESKGNEYWLYTYYPVQVKDFEIIRKIIWEHLEE